MSSTPTQPGSSMPKLLFGVVAGAVFIGLGMTVFKETAPPLLQGIDFNLGKTFVQIGVVLILFPLIYTIFFKPLNAAIQERNDELEKTFTEAEDLRTEMAQMRTEYERRMALKEAEAREQIQAQIKEAQQLRQTLMGEAAAKADDLVRRANQEIEAEKARVLNELRLGVVNLTLTATEKLLGENIDSAKNRRLVEEFIDQIEVKA